MSENPLDDPETRQDFAALIVLALSIQQRHGLALRKLRRTICHEVGLTNFQFVTHNP